MIGIYKITNPLKGIYIGQSVNIEKRFKTYKLNNCKSQRALYNSFLKYGIDKHKFEILCECNIEELNDKERYYQDLYSVLNGKGLNCRLTTSKDKSGHLSIFTKIKIKESNIGKNLGKKHTDEAKIKISKSSKGNKHNLGKKLSEEHKLKIKFGLMISDKFNESIKNRIMPINKKEVILNNNEIFSSIIEASKKTGVSNTSICNNIKGLSKKTKVGIWTKKIDTIVRHEFNDKM